MTSRRSATSSGRVLTRYGYEPVLAETGAAALDDRSRRSTRRDPLRPPDGRDDRHRGLRGASPRSDPDLARHFVFMSGDVFNPSSSRSPTAHGVPLLAKPFEIAALQAILGRDRRPTAVAAATCRPRPDAVSRAGSV